MSISQSDRQTNRKIDREPGRQNDSMTESRAAKEPALVVVFTQTF